MDLGSGVFGMSTGVSIGNDFKLATDSPDVGLPTSVKRTSSPVADIGWDFSALIAASSTVAGVGIVESFKFTSS